MSMARTISTRLLAIVALTAISAVVRGAEPGTDAAPPATLATRAHSELPKTMRAAAIDRPGGPEVLTIHTLPVPEIGADEVLIAVHTAGVAVWDAGIRQQLMYVSKPRFPLVMGSDGAGLVALSARRSRPSKPGTPFTDTAGIIPRAASMLSMSQLPRIASPACPTE